MIKTTIVQSEFTGKTLNFVLMNLFNVIQNETDKNVHSQLYYETENQLKQIKIQIEEVKDLKVQKELSLQFISVSSLLEEDEDYTPVKKQIFQLKNYVLRLINYQIEIDDEHKLLDVIKTVQQNLLKVESEFCKKKLIALFIELIDLIKFVKTESDEQQQE